MDNLAEVIIKMQLEFIFDVNQVVDIDQAVTVLVSNSSKPTQRIQMRVKSYENIGDGHTRIRLYARKSDEPEQDNAEQVISLPIDKGQAIPHGIVTTCPTCHSTVVNTFFANQAIGKDQASMPLYSCSACGATRSMLALLTPREQ